MFKSKVLKRSFYIYIAFSVCLICIFFSVSNIMLAQYAETYTESVHDVIQNGVTVFQNDVRNACNSVIEFISDYAFSSLTGTDVPEVREYVDVQKMHKQFARLVNNRDVGTDCGLILPNGLVLSPERIYFSGDDMYPNFFSHESYPTYSDWLSALETEAMTMLPAAKVTVNGDASMALVLAFRLVSGEQSTSIRARRMLFYCIYPTDYFEDLLLLPGYGQHCSLSIQSNDGAVLYDSGRKITDVYTVQHFSSSILGLRFNVQISKKPFTEKMHVLERTVIIALIAFSLIAFLLSTGFARSSTKAIRRIAHRAAEVLPEDGKTKDILNEYDFLEERIIGTGISMEKFKKTIMEQNSLLKAMVLRQILDTRAVSSKQKMGFLQFFPDFPSKYILIFAKLSEQQGDIDIHARSAVQRILINCLEKALYKGSILEPVSYSGAVAAIVPVDENYQQADLKARLQSVEQVMTNEVRCECHFLISVPADTVEALPTLFSELTVLYRLNKGTPVHYTFCEDVRIDNANTAESIISCIDDRFSDAVMRGEDDNACEMITDTLSAMHKLSKITEQAIACVFYAYASRLTAVQNRLPATGSVVALPVYDDKLSLDELFAQLMACTKGISRRIIEYRNSVNSAQQQDIITYINQHLSDTSLCAQELADYFGMNEYTLQRIIHQSFGKSVFEYIDERRMERARKLLTETSIPVTQVSDECGYSSRNSFYKAFKRTFGVSPSDLRTDKKI